jgi:hypothetical protein
MVPDPNEFSPGSGGTAGISAREWFRRFRELYDRAADSPLTDLGLFYERHRQFVAYEAMSDPNHPEYTDEEWDRVMAGFLANLSGELGLVQARDWQGDASFEWFWPTDPQHAAVTIHPANHATEAVLRKDLPEVVKLGADLAVVLLYPDYPQPPGAEGIEEATREWRGRFETALRSLRPSRQFLLLTISAFVWDLPAPWRGFVWDPDHSRLEEAR